MPHNSSVLREPGKRFSKVRTASLPKQENSVLSIASVPESRESDLRHGLAEALRILRAGQGRNLQNSGRANQQLRVPHQLFFLKDRRQQPLLDVNHHQRAPFGLERAPCDLGLIRGRILDHGRHIVTSFRLLDEMSAIRANLRNRRSIRSLCAL